MVIEIVFSTQSHNHKEVTPMNDPNRTNNVTAKADISIQPFVKIQTTAMSPGAGCSTHPLVGTEAK
jgi:hypothetical protein